MKKYNLLKVLAITLLVAIILTLFIPGSTADYTGAVTKNGITGVGIWGALSNINISLSYFASISFFIIAIAIFYSVLGNLKSYNNIVEKIANSFKGKEKILVILVTILFGLVGAVISDVTILLVFVPFVYKIMTQLGLDKKNILASTIIASLIGAMCGIYSSTLFSIFSIKVSTLILIKMIVWILSIFILIMFTAPKTMDKKEQSAIIKTKEESKKQEVVKKEATSKKKAAKTTSKKTVTKKEASKTSSKSKAKTKGKKVS